MDTRGNICSLPKLLTFVRSYTESVMFIASFNKGFLKKSSFSLLHGLSPLQVLLNNLLQ